MEKAKKVLGLLLAMVMVMSLMSACSTEEVEEVAEAVTEEVTEVAEEAEEAVEEVVEAVEEMVYDAEIQEIIDRGVLRVGVKNAVVGFGFQDPLTKEFTGLEIEIASKIAETLGVETEFTAVTAATRTALLDAGDIDCVLATFTITDERKESWDFSTPYYTDFVTVLVENASSITTLEGLVDKKVGVSSGSTSARALTTAMIEAGYIDGTDFAKDTFDPATWTEGISFQQYDDYPTISTGLSAGEIDAFCVDKSILAVYNTDSRSYIDDKFSPQDYGVATKKDSAFTAYVETLVAGWLADGTIDSLISSNGLD